MAIGEMKSSEVERNGRNNKLTIDRYFSKETESPYDRVNWTNSDVQIKNELGEVLFIQKDSEFPEYFSPLARSVVSSRYSYGEMGTDERETSLRDIIGRVTETYGKQSFEKGYFNEREARIFGDELAELTLRQKFAFNSPVWFNVGTDRYESRKNSEKSDGYHINEEGRAVSNEVGKNHLYPQTSACFIQFVDDTMEDIMDLATKEAMLFKYGSGTGTDLSTLRSSREKLSGGGKPSGPLQYLQFYDKVAQIVKSGGKTRRAAKMNSLKIWHPDIKEFIFAKANEEDKAKALMESGYSARDASDSVAYQNANLSVRLTDEFMRAVENDEEWQTKPVHSQDIADKMPKYKARDLMKWIAENAWRCGDPGLQYDTIINRWHTAKNTGEINASNPCSEYMFLDDTSCNLASVNLMKFKGSDGTFLMEDFESSIRTFSIAMDLNYEFSSFPSKSIAQNSYDNRTLGLGYANLGSLIMSEGLAYDSDEARALTGAITALTAAKVYETSTEIAEKLGTFKNHEDNKEPMMEVMRMHRDALKGIDKEKILEKFRPIYDRAGELWDNVVERGEKYGFRNAQGTVLAPTGTIAFMMDCDTTGIEPELALIKYKRLAEGGLLKIVNQTVPSALEKLGYDEGQREEITKYLYDKETIEGAPNLKDEHLPIFDCSFKPQNGERSIPWEGHVKMMAAAQPFLSGAISKTVNMPKDSTVEDIQGAYEMGWKLGLKALAIYRDESKAWQALSTGKKLENKVSPDPAERVKLPNTRQSITHKFTIDGHDIYTTVGHYTNGKPGELFISMGKEGGTLSGMMDNFGTAISIGLQHGVPLTTYVKKFTGTKFDPSGWVEEGDKEDIKQAKSILDYLFRWIDKEYLNGSNTKNPNGNGNLETVVVSENSGNPNINENITPRGPKSENFCTSCGNNSSTYKLGDCEIFCDPNFHGCGFLDPKGCSG